MTVSTANAAALDIDREFRTALAHGATTDEVRMARVLIEVNAVEVNPRNTHAAVSTALGAAARLIAGGQFVHPGQVRRLYGNGGITYDLVNEAVTAR